MKLPLLLAVLVLAGTLSTLLAAGDSPRPAAPAQLSPLEEPLEAMLTRQLSGNPDVDLTAAYQRARAQNRRLMQDTKSRAPGVAAAKWELVGPTKLSSAGGGGRLMDVVVDPKLPDTLYVAAASGGVWKSTDAGKTLESIWPADYVQPIGSVAVAPDGTLYVGTGETGPGGGSITYAGDGVYKSTDRGKTWQHIGLRQSSRISEVLVDPHDPNRIWVAASGPLFKPGGERGLFRSDDAGKTWKLVLEGDNATTGAVDIAIHPEDPKTIYAATWDHLREPDRRQYTGPGSGVYKSIDGGETWARIGVGAPFLLPNPQMGRPGIALAPSEPDTLYVQSSGPSGAWTGFYKSTNGGQTFTVMPDADHAGLGGQSVYGWWFGRVWVDPNDANHLFVAGVNLWESNDGGTNFNVGGAGVHADQHGMVWDPKVKDRIYLANDGGLYRSDDNGREWVASEYQPTGQLYSIDVSEQDPSRIMGGFQDNGVNRSYPDEWNSWIGGDGEAARINPQNQDIVFGCYQYGECSRSTDGGDSSESFTQEIIGTRKNWFTPIEFDPTNPAIVYTASEIVHRSEDEGETWVPISPDLTNGPGRETNPLFINYGTVTTISAAPAETGKIYAGTDDGNLWFTDSGGTVWTKASDPDLPKAWVSRVQADPRDKNVAYVTFSGFRQGEDAAYILRTTDGGASWENISGNLPQAPLNDVNIVGDDLVVGGDLGVFVSRDQGKSWLKVGSNLPLAPVHEMRYHKPSNQLFVATFGRAVWKLDYSALDRAPSQGEQPGARARLLPKACVSSGRLRFKVRAPRGETLKKVTLRVGGKKVTLKGKRIKRTVTVRTRRSVKVKLVATSRSGKRFTDTRTYRVCKKKRR